MPYQQSTLILATSTPHRTQCNHTGPNKKQGNPYRPPGHLPTRRARNQGNPYRLPRHPPTRHTHKTGHATHGGTSMGLVFDCKEHHCALVCIMYITLYGSTRCTSKKRIQLRPLTNGASTATQPQLCRFLVPTTTSSHLPGSPSWGVDPGEVDLTSMWWPRFGRPCKGAMMRTESAGGAAHQLQGGAVRLVAALPFQRPARAPSAAFAGGKATH